MEGSRTPSKHGTQCDLSDFEIQFQRGSDFEIQFQRGADMHCERLGCPAPRPGPRTAMLSDRDAVRVRPRRLKFDAFVVDFNSTKVAHPMASTVRRQRSRGHHAG
eukprot:1068936-Rhodomonas_salina.1